MFGCLTRAAKNNRVGKLLMGGLRRTMFLVGGCYLGVAISLAGHSGLRCEKGPLRMGSGMGQVHELMTLASMCSVSLWVPGMLFLRPFWGRLKDHHHTPVFVKRHPIGPYWPLHGHVWSSNGKQFRPSSLSSCQKGACFCITGSATAFWACREIEGRRVKHINSNVSPHLHAKPVPCILRAIFHQPEVRDH